MRTPSAGTYVGEIRFPMKPRNFGCQRIWTIGNSLATALRQPGIVKGADPDKWSIDLGFRIHSKDKAMQDFPTIDTIALIPALFGAVCMVVWPTFKSHRVMLLTQMGIGTGFALHFALLQHFGASILNLLGAVQLIIVVALGPRNSRLPVYLLVGVMCLAGLCVWNGVLSLISTGAVMLVAVGRMQTEARKMKALVFAGMLLWFWHDWAIGSIVAFADLFSIATLVLSIARDLRGKGPLVLPPMPPAIE